MTFRLRPRPRRPRRQRPPPHSFRAFEGGNDRPHAKIPLQALQTMKHPPAAKLRHSRHLHATARSPA